MKYRLCLFLFGFLLAITGCKKGFLDAKPKKSLVVPRNIEDFQGLLDNVVFATMQQVSIEFIYGIDDWFTNDDNFQAMAAFPSLQNAYIWEKDIYEGNISVTWTSSYTRIMYANLALEGAESILPRNNTEVAAHAELKGGALFFRAKEFFYLLEFFAKPFDPHTQATDPGVVLKISSLINEKSTRATVKECYDQLINDLIQAVELLPVKTAVFTRPGKAAAHGMLARVYLVRGEYDKALFHANEALKLNNKLLNFAGLNPSLSYPFPIFNDEVNFHMDMASMSYVTSSDLAFIDTTLYNSYDINDLRKELFFIPSSVNGRYIYRGQYTGDFLYFSGLTTGEMYLIKAECLARANKREEAMLALNTLLISRWKPGTFIPFDATDSESALRIILQERRKELLMRGLRWIDLRRLNKDPRFAVTLTRIVNGKTYTLTPNSNRYVYPIPQEEIDMLGLEQNPR